MKSHYGISGLQLILGHVYWNVSTHHYNGTQLSTGGAIVGLDEDF